MLPHHPLLPAFLLLAVASLAPPFALAEPHCEDEGGGDGGGGPAWACRVGWVAAPPGCDAGCVAGLLPEGIDGVWVGHSGEPASFCVGVFADEDGVDASADLSRSCGEPPASA